MNFPHIQVVVMSFGQGPSRLLARWLSKYNLDWRYSSIDYGVDVIHNHSITRFLKEDVFKGKTHLLSIDSDMVPLPETYNILTSEGDLLYCGHVGRYGSKGHTGDDEFSIGCYRASIFLLQKMSPPWVRQTIVKGVRVQCECSYFKEKARRVGYQPKMVSHIGHEQRCILLPSDTPLGWKLAWPTDLGEID